MSERRHHVVLVPGFAGFDVLGPLSYYDGVTEALVERGFCLHFFESLPTAGVATRAAALAQWLAESRHQGAIQRGDAIHLVGHSTGGLDIRQLMRDLARRANQRLCPASPATGSELRALIRSVQLISTPHRGTNLASWAARLAPLPQIAATSAFTALTVLGPTLWTSLGSAALALRSRPSPPNLVDAAIETLSRSGSLGDGFERARARGVFYALVRWLNEMMADFQAVDDLLPPREAGPRTLTPDWGGERQLYAGVALRSIVNAARPRASGSGHPGGRFDSALELYRLLDILLRHQVPESIGDRFSIPHLRGDRPPVALDRQDHDGIVNSVSMVWPSVEHSSFVEADHADVIGHFGGGRSSYDLLPSGADFDARAFDLLWADIADFIEASPAVVASS